MRSESEHVEEELEREHVKPRTTTDAERQPEAELASEDEQVQEVHTMKTALKQTPAVGGVDDDKDQEAAADDQEQEAAAEDQDQEAAADGKDREDAAGGKGREDAAGPEPATEGKGAVGDGSHSPDGEVESGSAYFFYRPRV